MSKASIAILIALSSTMQISAQTLVQDQTVIAPVSSAKAEEYPIKYTIFSSAWGTRSDAGIRLVAQNMGEQDIILESILFQDENDPLTQLRLTLDLPVSPHAWAEKELSYVDLLFGNDCIGQTMNQDWKLVEISNYTLNPSVRGLIIEDTDSFRIYQCVRNVKVSWLDKATGEQNDFTEWVMYHFERQLQN